jgi:hypothetical protein
VLILSFNTLDERLKSPLASGDLLKAIDDLSEKWKLLIDETKRLNIPLAVVSDHGFREVSGASTVPIAYAVSPEFVRWTLRERSSSEELPEGCIQIGDYLLAVGSHVLRPTSRRYEHGGVSLRELVVPLAIGRPMRTLRAPDIELIDNQVIEQESGKLRFAIKNPNDVDLTLDLSLTPDNLRLDNLYLPPISGLHISARQSQEVAFTLRVSKIEDFTKDARANSAQRKIRLDCSYCAPATSVASKPFQFSVSVKKNIRVTDRGAIEKELEELGI